MILTHFPAFFIASVSRLLFLFFKKRRKTPKSLVIYKQARYNCNKALLYLYL